MSLFLTFTSCVEFRQKDGEMNWFLLQKCNENYTSNLVFFGSLNAMVLFSFWTHGKEFTICLKGIILTHYLCKSKEICGTYQLKNTMSYDVDYIKSNGEYKVEIDRETVYFDKKI